MKSTAKQRVLLHLFNQVSRTENGMNSYSSSQDGIADAVDTTRGFVSRTLTEMKGKDLVEEKKCDVGKYQKRKVKVYRLTSKGQEKAKALQKKFLEDEFIIKTLEKERRIKGKELKNYISTEHPLLTALVNIDKKGKLDMIEYEKLDRHSFINRKKELGKLKEYLEYVTEKGCMTVFISGESGCGKTKLCLKFQEEVENEEIHFLTGKIRKETSIPFKPFINAFKGYKYDIIDIDFKKLDIPTLETDKNEFFKAKKRSYFQRITENIKIASFKKPIIIFLDDLQSADAATIELLKFLTKNLDDAPVLFLCTYKLGELSKDNQLEEVKKELLDNPNCQNIRLNNFDLDNSREFLFELTKNPNLPFGFVKLLHNTTQGNPFFLKEYIKLLIKEEKIPPHSSDYPTKESELKISNTLKNVIKRRLESHLSEKTRNVVLSGCAIGDQISFRLLNKMVRMNKIELLRSVEELIEKNIWMKGTNDGSFYFSHQLISKVAYEEMPSSKKKRIHLKAAENIENLYEENIEDHYPDLARHYEKGEEITKAVDYYIKAGDESEKVLAHEDAVEMYERAIYLFDKEEINKDQVKLLDIVKRVAKTYSLLGRFEKSREYLAKAVELTENKKEKKDIYSKIAETYFLQEKFDRSLNYIEDSLNLQEEDDEITCKLLSLKGWIYLRKEDLKEAETIFNKEKEIAEVHGSDKEIGQVYHDLGTVYLGKNNHEMAIEKFKKSIEIREKIDDKIGLNQSYNNLAMTYRREGHLKKAEKYFEKSLEVCEDVRYKVKLIDIFSNLGSHLLSKGKLKKSLSAFRRGYKLAQELDHDKMKIISSANLSKLYLKFGDIEKSKNYLEECKEMIDENSNYYLQKIKIDYIHSELKRKEGDLGEAKEKLLKVKKLAKEKDDKRVLAQTSLRLGRIYSLQGDFEKGKEYYEKAKKYSLAIGYKEIVPSVYHGLAKIEMKRGELEKARNLFNQGLKLSDELNNEGLMIKNMRGIGEYNLKISNNDAAEKCLLTISEKIENREEPELSIRNNLFKGKLFLNKSDLENAKDSLEKALNESGKADDEILKSIALYQLSRLHLMMEERSKAEKQLELCKEIFDDIGMEWWKKQVKEHL